MHLDTSLGSVACLLLSGALSISAAASPGSGGLDTGGRTAQPLVLPEQPVGSFSVRVQLGDEACTLDLVRDSVRSQRFELWVPDASGLTRAMEVDEPSTYRGLVREWPGARVSASLRSGGLFATVLGAPGEVTWALQPSGGLDRARRPLHVAYTSSDLPQLEGICQVEGDGWGGDFSGDALRGGTILAAELAFDVDYSFYVLHGSSIQESIASIEATLHTVNLIYEHQLDVRHELVGGFVRTDQATDPYAPYAGNALALNAALKDEWNQNHASFQRNTVHLFSGPPSGSVGGAANNGRMCGDGFGTSLFLSNPLRRVILLAHELGHNWGACHCNVSYCNIYDPPNCSIMSSAFGGKQAVFAPLTVARLLAKIAEFSGCLHPGTPSPPPVLSSIQPTEIQVFGGDPMVLNGSFLDHVLYVHVAEASLYLEDFEVLDPATMTFSAPMGNALGAHLASVQGPGESSTPVGFTYVETSPPRIRGPFEDGSVIWGDQQWTYGGRVGLQLDLLMARSDMMAGAPGLEILAKAIVVHSEILAPPGLGTYTHYIPSEWAGLEFWLQAVLSDGGQILEVSEPLYNWVFNP